MLKMSLGREIYKASCRRQMYTVSTGREMCMFSRRGIIMYSGRQLFATLSGRLMCIASSGKVYRTVVSGRERYKGFSMRQMCTVSSVSSHWLYDIPVSLKSRLDGKTDIHSTIRVIDTDNAAPNDKPLVLAIHGMPGTGDDFEPLLTELHRNGVRMVAPSFIGFEGSFLEPWQLNHVDFSTQGRSDFLKILLDEMGINRVDMVLPHSGGTWLAYKMMAEWDHVRSGGLISPVGARPHRMISPHFGVRSVAALLRVKQLLPLLLPLSHRIFTLLGMAVRPGTHLYAAQQVVANQQFEHVPEHIAKIAKKKLPFFIAHSLSDKVVEWDVSQEIVTKYLNIPPEHIIDINRNRESDIDPLKVFLDDWLARVLLFESGGHLPHKSHSDLILQQILYILKHLENSS